MISRNIQAAMAKLGQAGPDFNPVLPEEEAPADFISYCERLLFPNTSELSYPGGQVRLKWYGSGSEEGTVSEELFFQAVPGMNCVPRHLMPWADATERWKEGTSIGFDAALRCPNAKGLKVIGPICPVGFGPWVIAVGIDPAVEPFDAKTNRIAPPMIANQRYTTLLLVAAPKDWIPKQTAILRGRFGERLFARLDGLIMQMPSYDWDAWAYGAIQNSECYFLEVETENEGVQ